MYKKNDIIFDNRNGLRYRILSISSEMAEVIRESWPDGFFQDSISYTDLFNYCSKTEQFCYHVWKCIDLFSTQGYNCSKCGIKKEDA